MIEKVQYKEHRLEQCDRKDLWRECSDCGEVIAVTEFKAHEKTHEG